ncbi:hypothetical protein AAMO2058_001379200 [Amorphochlora amoebiformis]
MLSYSLTCLTNLCVDEVSCEEMIDLDVFDVICKVLKRNPYNESLQRLVNNFIQKLAINEDMAKLIAQKFNGIPLNDSLQNHLDGESLASTCDTTCHLMDRKFAGKMEKLGMVQNLANVLRRNNNEQIDAKKKDHKVSAAAAKLCRKMVKVRPELSESIINSGLTDDLLRAIRLHPENIELVLAAIDSIRLIADSDPALAAILKQKGVVDIMVRCLEKNADNKEILECGAEALRVLGTTNELAAAMGSLKSMDGGVMATVGALSLVGKNVDYLIKNGGAGLITGLLRDLAENSEFSVEKDENAKRFIVNGCRALEHMSTDEKNIFEIMKEKGAQVLLDIIRKCYKDPDVAASAYSALAALASRPENAEYIMKLGVLPSLMALAKNFGTKDAKFARKALHLLNTLAQNKDLSAQIIKAGALKRVFAMAKAHRSDKNVIRQMLELSNNLINQLGPSALEQIAANGGIEAIVKALETHGDDPEIAKMALMVMEQAAESETGLKQLRAAGALNEVLSMLKKHKNDKKVVQLASRVAGKVVTEEDVKSYMKSLDALLTRVKNGDEAAIPELLELTNLLAGIAAVPENRELMAKSGILNLLEQALDIVEALKETPEKAQILQNLAQMAAFMAQNKEVADIIQQRGLHKRILDLAITREDEAIGVAAIDLFRELAKDPNRVRELQLDGSLEVLKLLGNRFEDSEGITSKLAEMIKEMSKNKTVNIKDAIALSLSALGNHQDSKDVANELEYLIQLTNQKGAVFEMLDKGLIPQIVDVIQTHQNNDKVQKASNILLNKLADKDEEVLAQFCLEGGIDISCRAMRKMFNVEKLVEDEVVFLARVAQNPENMAHFVKNGMVNARLLAWAVKAYKNNENISEKGMEVLKKIENELFLIKKQREKELDLATDTKREEELKAGQKVSKETLQFVLQGMDPNNPDIDAFEGLLAIVGNPENSRLFVEAGGLEFMNDVLIGEKMDDDTFQAAVICFDTALGSLDSDLIQVVGDQKAMSMMMQVLNPKKSKSLNWDNLGNTLRTAVGMTEDQRILKGMLDRGDLKGALMMINATGSEASCLIPAMKLMARISNHPDEMLKFANPENLHLLIEAMRKNLDKPDFEMYGCYLLGNLSTNAHIQNLIGEFGGIKVISTIMEEYPDRPDVIEKCCYACRALSVKNIVNCGLMSRYNIPFFTLAAMEEHSSEQTRFWVNTLRLLLNLCKHGQYAEEIQKAEGDMKIIQVIYNKDDDDVVVKFCCKVLERLVSRQNYVQILENSIIHALHPTLARGEEHQEAVVAAMHVIHRLAQFSRSNTDAMGIFIAENAHKAVCTCVKQHRSNESIMSPAVECLTQMSYDDHCSTTIVRRGVVEVLRDSLVELAYDEKFCLAAVQLVDRLSYNTANISSIVDSRVVYELSSTSVTYIESQPIISRFLSATGRICAYKNSALLLAADVIPAIAKITANYLDDASMLLACFAALGSLTFTPQTALLLSQKSCTLSLKAMKSHFRHAGLKRGVLEFLSSLFLQPKAAEVGILETGILSAVVNKLKVVQDALLDNVLTTLYHAATSTNKVKDKMKSASVIQDLKDTKAKFNAQEHIQEQCDKIITAILTPKVELQDLNFTQANADDYIDTSTVWGERKVKQGSGYTISAKLKNFLIAGVELKWHSKKHGVLDTHLRTRKDLKKIVWTKDLGGKALSMGTWRIRSVKPGTSKSDEFTKKSKKSFKVRVPLENRAFVILGEDAAMALECPSEAMRNKWVKALEALKLHHKDQKKLATDFVIDGVYEGYSTRI